MKIFLIVDDSPVIRKVASRIISDLGYVVVESEDGLDALEKAQNSMPDAILVDWDLPSMSGVEFIEEFRKLPGSKATRIVFCTSEVIVSEMTRAKRAGANGFMLKPFNREIITHKIGEICSAPVDTAAA